MQGIIFDFNGTMVFDHEIQEIAWRQYIRKKCHREISEDEMQEWIHGRNAIEIFQYLFGEEFSAAEVARLEEEKEIIYRDLCLHNKDFHLAEGLPEWLDRLKEKGIVVTVATASARPNVEFFFRELSLGKWFGIEKVVYNDGTFRGKPQPDIFLRAAEKIKISISRCTIFEDSVSGIRAAKASGCLKVVGVASMLSEDELLKSGADRVIYDYRDMDGEG